VRREEARDALLFWSELRVFIHAPCRRNGYGSALFATAADRLEASGRRVCAQIEVLGEPER
jgi:GNAT superfamily N-acetyltransferase